LLPGILTLKKEQRGGAMGHLFFQWNKYKNGHNALSHWARTGIVGIFVLFCSLAQAGVLTVTATQRPDGLLMLTVKDAQPQDMCDEYGICAADFAIAFDPAALTFADEVTAPSLDYSVLANVDFSGPGNPQVLVSFTNMPLNFGDPAVFDASNELFSLGFRPLGSTMVSLTVGLREFPGQVIPIYQRDPVSTSFTVVTAVPEPSTAWMALLGLGCLAWAVRRRPVQSPVATIPR
jgi:hypothetical protein